MLKQIPKLVLLAALVATFVVSSAPAFANGSCQCYIGKIHQAGCKFDKSTVTCVNTGCAGVCI